MQKISHRPFLVRTQCKKFRITFSHCENFRTANSQCKKFHINFTPPTLNTKIFASAIPISHQPNVNAKNFAFATSHVKCQWSPNGQEGSQKSFNFLFKDLQLTILHKHPLLRRAYCRLVKQISCYSTPRSHQGGEEQSTSRPY